MKLIDPKGPIIGPLVIAGVLVDSKGEEKLKKICVKDSKLLTAKQRQLLAEKIKKIATAYKIIKIYPKEIDKVIDHSNSNLNWLEAEKSAEILNSFKIVDEAILDCPSPNIEKYKNFIKKLIKKDMNLILEHKAERFPSVAAASILAKTIRDQEIEEIKEKYGDCGPGYPSNSVTMEFVRENLDKYPEIFRKSWSTFKREKGVKKQRSLGDYGS